MRGRSVSALVVLALAVGLAACGGDAPASEVASPPASAGGSSAPSGDPVVLGASLGLTGNFAPDSDLVLDGYEFCVDTINEAGGIDVAGEMRSVELLVRDDGSDTNQTVSVVESLITVDGVDFLLAPWGSGNTNAVAPIAERYQIPMVAPLAASDAVWEQGYKYLFGILPPGSASQKPMIDMAGDLGLTSVAVIATDDLFPLLAAEGAVARAEELDIDVVLNEIYPPGQLDLGAVLTQLQDTDADLVVATIDTNDAILLVRQMKERGYYPQLLGLAGPPVIPEFIDNLGADANGIAGMTWWTPDLPVEDELFGTARDFATAFEAKNGYMPTHDNVASAMACYVFKLAVEAVGTTDPGAVRDALADLDVETSFGQINFAENNVNLGTSTYVVQIQDETPVVVFPEEFAKSELVYPVPGWDER